MVLNAIFNNISVIPWLSVLLIEETGVPGENHRPVASHRQTVSLKVVSTIPHYCDVLIIAKFHSTTDLEENLWSSTD